MSSVFNFRQLLHSQNVFANYLQLVKVQADRLLKGPSLCVCQQKNNFDFPPHLEENNFHTQNRLLLPLMDAIKIHQTDSYSVQPLVFIN